MMQRKCRAIFAVSLAALLAGFVDPRREVAVYRDVLDGHAPATTRPAAQPIEADATLTLTEALALASRDNERLALRGEDYLQALIDKDRTFATFLPTIGLAPTQTLLEPVGGATPGRFGHVAAAIAPMLAPRSMPIDTHNFDVPVTLDLSVNGYRDSARLRVADLTIEQRRAALLDLQASLHLETVYAYYGVLKAERAVAVLTNSLAVQETRVAEVSDKVRAGVARQLDLEQSRAQAASTRVQLTDADNRVVTSRAALALLIGVPYVHGGLQSEGPTVTPPAELVDLLVEADGQRQDLAAARAAVAAARQGVEVAIGQFYPAVSVNLDALLYRESFPSASSFAAVFGVRLPLFTGGRLYADLREAWSRHRQALAAESLLARQIAEQVERAHADYGASLQRLRDLETAVDAARAAFRIASESYNTGLATNLDRLDAQDRLLSAELRLESERYDTSTYYLSLLRMVGRPVWGEAAQDADEPAPEAGA